MGQHSADGGSQVVAVNLCPARGGRRFACRPIARGFRPICCRAGCRRFPGQRAARCARGQPCSAASLSCPYSVSGDTGAGRGFPSGKFRRLGPLDRTRRREHHALQAGAGRRPSQGRRVAVQVAAQKACRVVTFAAPVAGRDMGETGRISASKPSRSGRRARSGRQGQKGLAHRRGSGRPKEPDVITAARASARRKPRRCGAAGQGDSHCAGVRGKSDRSASRPPSAIVAPQVDQGFSRARLPWSCQGFSY